MARLRWKQWLYRIHRWSGIGLCLLFAAWFFSGVVMMYVGFPALDHSERLAGIQALDFSGASLSPAQAQERLAQGDFRVVGASHQNRLAEVADPAAPVAASGVRLAMLAGRPVYRFEVGGARQPRVVFADNGELLAEVSPELAADTLAAFLRQRGTPAEAAPRYLGLRQTDQWSLSARLNAHRPLHHFALDDACGSEWYVSATTGEVVLDTVRSERLLNYVGAVTHWIYPTFIRRHPALWVWLVDILAGVGVLLAVSGLWIGLLRWRRRPRPGKSSVPYRGLMRWHYFAGAFFGLFTFTWVLSGLLSMNPGGFNPPRSISAAQHGAFSGVQGALRVTDFRSVPVLAGGAREAELFHFAGVPLLQVTREDGSRQVQRADGSVLSVSLEEIGQRAAALLPGEPLQRMALLTSYDDHYYSRHPQRNAKPLPVMRVMFADGDATWFHVDVLTGRVLERSTVVNRVYRWLYQGLHSWDLQWLWQRRPLWDALVILFSAGGLLLSSLGVMVGWRRLRFAFGASSAVLGNRPRRRG